MPASRWHSTPADLFDWIDENDAELLDMLMPSIFARFNQKKDVIEQPAAPRPEPLEEEIVPAPEM